MIESGVKREEYRDIKDYWKNRLMYFDIVSRNSHSSMKIEQGFKTFDTINFSNGYFPTSRKMIVECKDIDIGKAVPEWSDNWQGDVFRIHLGKILQRINF